uniref:Acetyl-CoA C-acetyltransferase n=1 Tax=Echinococcus granulosus TaxID=6210 RepID=A0A068WZ71_ECHGR|nr:hypothetical protein EgrG_002066000 [Echinococcus granulosus]
MYEGRRVNVDPFGVPAAIATAVVADFAMAKDVVADTLIVGISSNDAVYMNSPSIQLMLLIKMADIDGIKSDPVNIYCKHSTAA